MIYLTMLLSVSFFFVLACIAYQEIRIRKTQNYLVVSLLAISVIHLVGTTDDPLMLALFCLVVSSMLGMLRAGGVFKTSDWLCVSALSVFCLPFGIHVTFWSIMIGFTTCVLHHLVLCLGANLVTRNTFSDIQASRSLKLLAVMSCKRRSIHDRWAYPAIRVTRDNVAKFDIYSGMRGKRINSYAQCKYILPSIPVLTHMCIATLFVIVLF